MSKALTQGIDHLGLAVRDLDATVAFFVDCLGWDVVGEKPDYPAKFVADGHSRLTLWQVTNPADCNGFDRHQNVGLHHLALKVGSRAVLDMVHEKVTAWPGVVVEFAPELSGPGPKIHSMIREPSGNRIEIAWVPE